MNLISIKFGTSCVEFIFNDTVMLVRLLSY